MNREQVSKGTDLIRFKESLLEVVADVESCVTPKVVSISIMHSAGTRTSKLPSLSSSKALGWSDTAGKYNNILQDVKDVAVTLYLAKVKALIIEVEQELEAL